MRTGGAGASLFTNVKLASRFSASSQGRELGGGVARDAGKTRVPSVGAAKVCKRVRVEASVWGHVFGARVRVVVVVFEARHVERVRNLSERTQAFENERPSERKHASESERTSERKHSSESERTSERKDASESKRTSKIMSERKHASDRESESMWVR
jgi:flagellar biosynthesis GTPase FlhF